MPAYWLLKSEPDAFSWDELVSRGAKGESWDGVRNYQARNNMRAMKVGDLGFFYHSNEGKNVVGICRIIALAHPEARVALSDLLENIESFELKERTWEPRAALHVLGPARLPVKFSLRSSG